MLSFAVHFKRLFLSVGVREWAEIIGIMTDKETQGDEEVLIYAMTLINKVLNCSCYTYVQALFAYMIHFCSLVMAIIVIKVAI